MKTQRSLFFKRFEPVLKQFFVTCLKTSLCLKKTRKNENIQKQNQEKTQNNKKEENAKTVGVSVGLVF